LISASFFTFRPKQYWLEGYIWKKCPTSTIGSQENAAKNYPLPALAGTGHFILTINMNEIRKHYKNYG